MFWTGFAVGFCVWFALCAVVTVAFLLFSRGARQRNDVLHCCVCQQEVSEHEWTCPILENDRLRAALQFYAEEIHYEPDAWTPDRVTLDGGRFARAALEDAA